jgi:hypothetical protein
MTIRRAIFWSLFFATTPAVAYMSFDLVHVQEEFERYGVGAIPYTWWREVQPLNELDWRYKNDENWRAFRALVTKDDEVRSFRSPSRHWGNYEVLEGLMLVRQGHPIAHAVLSTDRRHLTSLVLPRKGQLQSAPATSASPLTSAKQITQKNHKS